MENIKEILIKNIKEYYKNAFNAENKEEYNSSVTLYFKAISALCDLYIFVKEGKIPSNHTERFRILELKYKEIYKIIDKDFPFYQDTYRTRLTKEVSLMFKDDTKRLFEILGIRI
jgi:hypothetical protein